MKFLSALGAFSSFALSALAAIPSIRHPAVDAVVNPGATFDFDYQSIADYGCSSYNYTVWLFTSPPDSSFSPMQNYASGYFFGRFAQANYPGNPYPHNPPPKQLTMPNLSKLGGGFGVGSRATNVTFFLTVLEEYGTSEASLGYKISLTYNPIRYNVTEAST